MKQSKWCRIEEENGPERGEFPLGGQDNEVVHPVIQDIFTQTAQGREVKQDEKRSEARGRRIRSQARGKVQVRMFKYLSVAELTFLQINYAQRRLPARTLCGNTRSKHLLVRWGL